MISRGRVRFAAKLTPNENGVFCTTLGSLFNSEELYTTHGNGLADTPVLFDDLNGVDSHGIHFSKSFITVFNITSGSLFGGERSTHQDAILKDGSNENIKHLLPGYIGDVMAGRDTVSGSPAIDSPVFEATDRFMTMNLNDIRQELNGYDLNLRARIETDDKGRRSVAMEDLLGADGLFSELYNGRRKFAEVPVVFGAQMAGDDPNTVRPRSDWITNSGRIANTKGKPEALKEFVIDRIMDMVTNARVHYDHLAAGNEPELEQQAAQDITPVFNYDVELLSSRDTNVLDAVKLDYSYAGISIKTNLTLSEEEINRAGSIQALSDDIANETFSRLARYAERELGATLSRTENGALGASFTLNGEEYTLWDLAKTIEPSVEKSLAALIPDHVQEQTSQESQEPEKQQPDSISAANKWSQVAKEWGLDTSLELAEEGDDIQQRVLDYIKEEGPRNIQSILSALANDTVTKSDVSSAVEALVNFDELVQMPSPDGSLTLELRERFEEKLATIIRNSDSPVALKDIQEQSGGFPADLERRLRRMSSEGVITWNSQNNTFSVPVSGKATTEERVQNIERQSAASEPQTQEITPDITGEQVSLESGEIGEKTPPEYKVIKLEPNSPDKYTELLANIRQNAKSVGETTLENSRFAESYGDSPFRGSVDEKGFLKIWLGDDESLSSRISLDRLHRFLSNENGLYAKPHDFAEEMFREIAAKYREKGGKSFSVQVSKTSARMQILYNNDVYGDDHVFEMINELYKKSTGQDFEYMSRRALNNAGERVFDYIKEKGPRDIQDILSVLPDGESMTKAEVNLVVNELVDNGTLVQMPSPDGNIALELRERFEEGLAKDTPETRVAVALSRLKLTDRTLGDLSRAERARFDVVYDALENGGRYNRKSGDNDAVSSCWRSGLLVERDGEFYLTKNEAEANAEVERQVLDYVREEPEGSTSENIIFVLAGDYAPAKNALNTAIKSLIAKGELLQTDVLSNGEIFFDVRDRVEERRLNVVQDQEQIQIEREQPDYASDTTSAPSEEKRTPTASSKTQRKENYHITDDALGTGGQKTKYTRNVAAIRTLKQIESEGRLATPDEQEVLAQYVGWGGLSQAFDKDNSSWAREYAELKELLTDEEYKSARGSTLNAHYTSPTVIKAIYETVERMGFTTGNILEPSCGTGNFFGLLPESMKDSKLYGVELDDLTGRIAKQLYQNADITISGFEKTKFQDNTFDLAIGNVPFGSYGVTDSKYDKNNFLIHDYFFAKALDQVRPGGVVAFITSKGTMDKQNASVRDYMAQRAELLGAVRLPNNAFKANAGTEVTTDILFLQKRQQPVINAKADWLEVSPDRNGVPVNKYFQNHPEMMLGTMAFDSSMYGGENETTCNPIEGAGLNEQLRTALRNIQGRIERWEQEIPEEQENKERKSIPALPGVRNYSFTVVDDNLYYREGSLMYEPANMSQKAVERAKAMVKLRDLCRTVIEDQFAGTSDGNLRASQEKLNKAYDDFVTRYGRINDSSNKKAFNKDSSYYLLCSLEVLDEKRNFERKADIFTKRTIRPNTIPTHADSAQDALTLSMSERARVDLDYMSKLTGIDKPKLISELQGAIFRVPDIVEPYTQAPVYQTADEYLSGNVRKKLETARMYAERQPELFSANVAALEQVQPRRIEAADIDIRLGSTWVDASIVKDFMCSLLETPGNDYHEVEYSPTSAAWNVTNKKHVYGNVLALNTYGTAKMNAYELIEDTLNLKQARVTKTITRADGGESQVTDYKETALAQQKQALIKRKFREWVFQDPDRRKYLVDKYNVQFNSIRTREYNGEHLRFGGINPGIELMPHQKNAIARVLYGGNTLLAHEVGAGKTFEMIASAMESKRLGLANKSLFVVPNHLTEQTATEMLRLYPGANVLVTTQEDFKKENRQNFCARIATGNYDAVIIGHSQFEKVPLSPERQQDFLQTQIDTITDAIEEMKDAGSSRWSIKQMEATRKRLEGRLEKLAKPSANSKQKDDVVTFEELGCDRLFVDEAHNYKNLYTVTKMGNVAGISQSESQKAMDMFLKCRYMDELTGGKGIIFATGTPVSNSITELYTMQRYLQYSTLQEMGLEHFDKWASTFGETTTNLELAPEGTGFRMKTRFAKFGNIPELMSMFKEVADIKTAESLNLPRPEVEYHTISVPATEEQKKLIENLSERAYRVHNRQVTPEQDNMLKITSDGRKIGLDQRLWNPLMPDAPGSKVNACVKNVLRIWKDTEKDRSTQIIFCDFSTPDKSKFNVYHDIKAKLIKSGVPEEEIAFIHDAKTDEAKDKLFAKVKSGAVRVLMGSTQKMGVGTNVQDRLIATHDLDCPWRPADMEQRAGRIVRRGNRNEKVDIYRYVTEGTFDAYLFQTLENKQKFISQVMTEKAVGRSCDDVDESVLSYSEIKALCVGDPRIKERMELDIQVKQLEMLRGSYVNEHYALQDKLRSYYPKRIENIQKEIAALEKDLQQAEATKEADFSMKILGTTYTDKKEAGEALLTAAQTLGMNEGSIIGEYRSFSMSLDSNMLSGKILLVLSGETEHDVELGESATGNLTRIEHTLGNIGGRLEDERNNIVDIQKQIQAAQKELERPFEQEEELNAKQERLAVLNGELAMDGERGETEEHTPEQSEENGNDLEIASEENSELDSTLESVTEEELEEQALEDLKEDYQEAGQETESEEQAQAPVPERKPQLHDIVQFTPKDPTLMPRQGELISIDGDIARLRFKHGPTMATVGVRWSTGTLQVVEAASQKISNGNAVTEPLRSHELEKPADRSNGNKRGGRSD